MSRGNRLLKISEISVEAERLLEAASEGLTPEQKKELRLLAEAWLSQVMGVDLTGRAK